MEPRTPWIDESSGLPLTEPFTYQQARECGYDDRRLAALVDEGLLQHPLRGVYHVGQLADSLALRLACLRLVVPPDGVVTDRTAGWLHGAGMVLAPGAHRVVPVPTVFRRPGYRLRNGLVRSGERSLADHEIQEVDGLLVTNPLRTACDLGRLLHRDQAFASLDAMLRLRVFDHAHLIAAVERFRGYRGVRQLRELAPDADPRSESQGESITRRRWLDLGDLPRPEPQIPVSGPWGTFWLDLGVRELNYAVEYDGPEWHGPERKRHDSWRRGLIRKHAGYDIDVVGAENIHGPRQDIEFILRAGIRRARRR